MFAASWPERCQPLRGITQSTDAGSTHLPGGGKLTILCGGTQSAGARTAGSTWLLGAGKREAWRGRKELGQHPPAQGKAMSLAGCTAWHESVKHSLARICKAQPGLGGPG